MAKIKYIFFLFIFIAACSTSKSHLVEVEMLVDSPAQIKHDEIKVFSEEDAPETNFLKKAKLKTENFGSAEESSEEALIELIIQKARSIGANAIIITKNEWTAQARRDLNVGGITTGIHREVEALAILMDN